MTALTSSKRLVVKIGSSILVDEAKGQIRHDWLKALTDDVARLHKKGCEVVLVSSGAIRLGRTHLKLAAGTLTEEELDDLRAERSWIIHELKSLA